MVLVLLKYLCIWLVGCTTQFHYLKGENSKLKNINEAWELIFNSFKKGYLLTTGVSEPSISGEKTMSNGLVSNHAYSILEVKKD